MSRYYNKIDQKRNRNSLILAYTILLFEIIAIFTIMDQKPYGTIVLILTIVSVFLISYLAIRTSVKYARRVSGMMLEVQETLLKGNLEDEMKQMDAYVIENPKYLTLYAFTLFAFTRILYGPKRAGLYLESTKKKLSKKRTHKIIKANFVIEQCYYYLMEDNIKMFLSSVDEMKTYDITVYERIMKQAKALNPKKIHVPEEHKELAFIAQIYTDGPNEEKIERLVNHQIPYYRMQYTLFILNYYKSVVNKEKIMVYQEMLSAFEGDIYPLRGE